jgi:serine protease Do
MRPSTILIALLLGLFSAAASDGASNRLIALSEATQELVAEVEPGVVQILTVSRVPGPAAGSGAANLLSTQRANGSGVILDREGYVVTNAHVVAGAEKIFAALPSARGDVTGSIVRKRGRRVEARLVGLDLETDLAVLQLEGEDFTPVELGDSDELRAGELVVAIGSPLGLQGSVSMGVVSAVGRQRGPEDPMVFIQTDAPINPGNSGGALVDTNGRLVGINTFILSLSGGSDGIGFAVPSNIVRAIYSQIREHGRVRRGEIGVRTQTIGPLLADALGLERDYGVILGDVEPGGPADRAGLRIGDIVVALGSKAIENGRQLDVNIYRYGPGDVIELRIEREGKLSSEFVAVRERDAASERLADMARPETHLVPGLGILGVEVDDDVRKSFPLLRGESGVAVARRSVDGPVFEPALLPGDVIVSLGGTPVESLEQLREGVRELEDGRAAVLQVQRGPHLLYIAFESESGVWR